MEQPQPEEPENQEEDQHQYPRRQNIVPIRYRIDKFVDTAFLGGGQIEEPQNIEEALEGKLSEKWKEAADSEYKSLMENGTWELVELPSGRRPVGFKWIFKTKHGSDGNVECYKARLVAKGYAQKYDDYNESFSPVVRYSFVRALLAFAVQNGMLIHQMDVVTAYLNGTLDEEIYMEHPPGYVKEGKECWERFVCKLKKSNLWLKQSPRCWKQF